VRKIVFVTLMMKKKDEAQSLITSLHLLGGPDECGSSLPCPPFIMDNSYNFLFCFNL